MPRLGKTPSRVLVSQLALALPRHVLGCLLSGQPAVPPDESTAELTACEILSSSCFDHIGKALTLLTSLCELAFHHRALREATLGQPAFAAQLTDAANMVLLAVTGPEAGACVGAAAEQERVQAALETLSLQVRSCHALAAGGGAHCTVLLMCPLGRRLRLAWPDPDPTPPTPLPQEEQTEEWEAAVGQLQHAIDLLGKTTGRKEGEEGARAQLEAAA